MTVRRLDVYLHDMKVGQLTQAEGGRLSFAYDAAAAPEQRLSFSMKVREEPYGHDICHAFFGGLLPEQEQRDKIAEYYGVSRKNDFRLLEIIGGDCAGAVSLYPEGEEPAHGDTRHEHGETPGQKLSHDEIAKIFGTLNAMPLLTAMNMRLSLAGAQNKLALIMDKDDEFYLPAPHQMTTHIIKPQHPRFADTVENEFFCMRLAAKLFKGTPPVKIVGIGSGMKALAIKRYDRALDVYEGEGKTALYLRRIHQEDFCQALGVAAENKYQNEGGPGFERCFDLLVRATTMPARDLKSMMALVCFNYLIGNNDAHAKNFSILYEFVPQVQHVLAPAYDILCTEVYDGLSKKMAMKIGNGNNPYDPYAIFPRHWHDFAQGANVSYPYLQRTMAAMIESLGREIPALIADLKADGVRSPVFAQIAGVFEKRRAHIASYD